MYKEQLTKSREQIKTQHVFLLLIIFTFLLISCPDNLQQARTGTFSLVIGRHSFGRTIIPSTVMEDFVEFKLDFISKDNGNTNFSETWTSSSGTVALNVGTWDLFVTAYLDDSKGVLLETAKGALENIIVSSGSITAGNVSLYPITTGKGTFSWNIDYPGNITNASLEIISIDMALYQQTFYFIGETTIKKNDSHKLDAGQYRVIFRLSNGQEEVVLSETLHIYQNMESKFSEIFTDIHFPVSLLKFALSLWDTERNEWKIIETGITAGHFSHLGVNGIDDDNLVDIVKWFNILCLSISSPQNIDELKTLVDAALIGIASEDADFIDAGNYAYQGEIESAISALVLNETVLYFDWGMDDKTVTVHVGSYEVVIVFNNIIPSKPPLSGTVSINGIAEVGQTLTANITYLGGSGDVFYQWKRGTSLIDYENSDTYIVQIDDIGSTIAVSVTRFDNSGSVVSIPTLPVNDPGLPVLTGIVIISGIAEVGQILTAETGTLGGSGDIYFQWIRDDDTVVGSNSNIYTVQIDDAGFSIILTVTRSNNSGSVTSEPTAPVLFPLLTGTVSIDNTSPKVGDMLTAVYVLGNGTGTAIWQWLRSDVAILGANSSTYIIVDDDLNKILKACVSFTEQRGSVNSDQTDVVKDANKNPVAADFDISNLLQTAGSVTTVVIIPKTDKSTGAITIFYNGSCVLPSAAGTYTITFNVTASTGWNAVTGLEGGILTVQSPSGITINLIEMNEWELTDQAAQVTPNTNRVFTVTGTYSIYRWFLNGTLVGTTSNYTFNRPVGIYQLVVVVTNSAGESRSARCWVTVTTSSFVNLTINTPSTVTITSGSRVEVRYTVSSAGIYRFESSNNGSLDPTAYTALVGGSVIDDDSAGNLNYWFEQSMIAGQTFTYWSGVFNNHDVNGTYSITVTRR